jgi:hypothetical protein
MAFIFAEILNQIKKGIERKPDPQRGPKPTVDTIIEILFLFFTVSRHNY